MSQGYMAHSVRVPRPEPLEYVSFSMSGSYVSVLIREDYQGKTTYASIEITRAQAKEFADQLLAALAAYDAAAKLKYERLKARKQRRVKEAK